jgi:hypothetical protein
MVDWMTWTKLNYVSGKDVTLRTVSHGTPTYDWFGHSFNPSGADQGFPYAYWSDSDWQAGNACLSVTASVTSFDLVSHQTGVEVITAVFLLEAVDESGTKSGYLKQYDADGNVINTVSWSLTGWGVGYWAQTWCWAATGVRNSEIDSNGTWNAVRLTGDYTDVISCTFSNLSTTDVTTVVDRGYIWVEGHDLWITNGASRAMKIPSNGSTYGTAAGHEGEIWLPDDDTKRLYYVDADGDIRHTKLGATNYSWVDTALPSVSATYAGDMWIDTGQDHYLYVVAHDGQVFRLGGGCLHSDTQ